MSDNPKAAQPAVPANLRQIAETGYTAWYQVDAEEMAQVLYEAGIPLEMNQAPLPKYKDLAETSKEVYRRQAMALIEALSRYTSQRFAEIEMYCIAMYRVLLALRSMAGEDGVIRNASDGTTVNLETALGWERPAPFAGLYNRLEAALIAARGLRQIRHTEAGGRPGGPAATANAPRRIAQEQEQGEAIDALLEMLASLDNTLSAGTPGSAEAAGSSAEAEGEQAPAPQAEAPAEPHYDPPTLVQSSSTMISAYAYDEAKQKFYVQWKKPGKQPPFGVYSNFTREAFRAFTTAKSKGSHMLEEVTRRPDLYPYQYLDKLPF